MRHVIVLLLGLFIGFVAALSLANALQRRHAWLRGTMHVLEHDLRGAREATRANACAAPAALPQVAQRMRLVAEQLRPALLPEGTHDRVLAQYVSQLQDELGQWDPTAACPVQAEALTRIGHACDACHRDYR